MRVLGVNGWSHRSHDASAALVENGVILSMCEEERLVGAKRAYDRTPLNACGWCLRNSGWTLDDVDVVSVGWDYVRKFARSADTHPQSHRDLVRVLLPEDVFPRVAVPQLEVVDHHVAHAASTFFTSGFDAATIVVVDGQGEDASSLIAAGIDGRVHSLVSLPIVDSLGYFYSAFCRFLGFRSHDAGKLMGLASYGTSTGDELFRLTNEGVTPTVALDVIGQHEVEAQDAVERAWIAQFVERYGRVSNVEASTDRSTLCISRRPRFGQREMDLAATAQQNLEKAICHLVQIGVGKTGSTRVCLAGGVALNSAAISRVGALSCVEALHVVPVAGDAGAALGAALSISPPKHSRRRGPAAVFDPYLGPEWTDDEVMEELSRRKVGFQVPESMVDTAALLLASGHMVGWFSGRAEVGPRALGNRSILADPRSRENLSRVNEWKGREWWRPLAPAVLVEEYLRFFELGYVSEHMTMTCDVIPEARDLIPAVVHVDGTARPQVVRREANFRLWSLLRAFQQLTGVPVLINTSFNLAGRPIVSSVEDALVTFSASTMDALVVGGCLLLKSGARVDGDAWRGHAFKRP